MRTDQLNALAKKGVIVPSFAEYTHVLASDGKTLVDNPALAMDAQPTLITNPNIGIPAFLANILAPKQIRVLTTPTKAAEIYGEQKLGTWTTLTSQFPVVEATGEVSSYGDYNNNGSVGSNYNWVPRESYHFQTVTQYGDRETEMFGQADIDYVSGLNYSSALVLTKFMNQMYFFGVSGLQNFGGLNDPSLLAPITPTTKAAGGTTWAVAIAVEVFNDVLALYTQLQGVQLQGLAEIDQNTPMTLSLSPTVSPNLGKVTQYTLAPVRQAIKEAFPNMRIVTAPEYATVAGQLMQLKVDEIDGDETTTASFTEKMRAGRVIPELSSFRQKKIAGGWGTIVKRPVAIASMIGL